MADTISDLHVRFTAETSGLTVGFRQVMRRSQNLGTSIAKGFAVAGLAIDGVRKVTALATAQFRKMAAEVSEASERIDELAKKSDDLGTTIAELRAARLVGAEAGVENVDKLLDTANRRLGEFIALGSGPASAMLKNLGLTAEELRAQDLFGQIDLVTQAMREAGFSAQEMTGQLGMLFGRTQAAEAARLFAEGSDSIRQTVGELERMGQVNREQAAQVEMFNDAWGRVNLQIELAWERITANLAPAIFGAAKVTESMLETVFDIAGAWADATFGAEGLELSLLRMADHINDELIPATLDWVDSLVGGLSGLIQLANTIPGMVPLDTLQMVSEEAEKAWRQLTMVPEEGENILEGTTGLGLPSIKEITDNLDRIQNEVRNRRKKLEDEEKNSILRRFALEKAEREKQRLLMEQQRQQFQATMPEFAELITGGTLKVEASDPRRLEERLPKALEKGSVAAQSAINSSGLSKEGKQLEAAEKAVDLLKNIFRAITEGRPVEALNPLGVIGIPGK